MATTSRCPDCTAGNALAPGQASSIRVRVAVTVWTGPDCTGGSLAVDSGIGDLSVVDVDDAIAAVSLGWTAHLAAYVVSP